MAFTVSEFQGALRSGGARPNLFQVLLPFPTYAGGTAVTEVMSFMARATSMPASEVGSIPVSYFGRDIKVAGDREFQDWRLTIINDEDFKVRDAFVRWSNALNQHQANLRNQQAKFLTGYQVNGEVITYAKTGEELKRYKMLSAFPTTISDIALDWGQKNTIMEFEVTMAYTMWTDDVTS